MSTSTNQKPMWQVSFGQATGRCHVATSTLTFLDTSAPLRRKCTRRLDRPRGGTARRRCRRSARGLTAPPMHPSFGPASRWHRPPPLSPPCSRPHSARAARPLSARDRFVRHPFACDTLSQRASDFGVPPILRLGPVLCAFWCGPLVLAPVLSSSRRRTPPPPRRRRRRRAPPPPPSPSRTTTITTATATVGAPATATTTTIAPRAHHHYRHRYRRCPRYRYHHHHRPSCPCVRRGAALRAHDRLR